MASVLPLGLQPEGMLAGAPEEDRKALRAFGINIGVGFQLKDDLLDAYADPKKFGKQPGGDILANKRTYLLIKALEKTKGKRIKELLFWLSAKKFKPAEKIRAVKEIYNALGIPEMVDRKVNQFFAKAFHHLDTVNGNASGKEALRRYTHTLIQRQS